MKSGRRLTSAGSGAMIAGLTLHDRQHYMDLPPEAVSAVLFTFRRRADELGQDPNASVADVRAMSDQIELLESVMAEKL